MRQDFSIFLHRKEDSAHAEPITESQIILHSAPVPSQHGSVAPAQVKEGEAARAKAEREAESARKKAEEATAAAGGDLLACLVRWCALVDRDSNCKKLEIRLVLWYSRTSR